MQEMLKIHYCFMLSQVPDQYFWQLGSMPLVATPLQCGIINCRHTFFLSINPMHSLLHIAARIEAAVASYVSVRHVANRAEWECCIEAEKVHI